MPSSALDGASKYLNNLLLARGFLHDGKSINFVRLTNTEDNQNDEFDCNATTATIINLIHDLVLRRDRDVEQREALSSTIRTLRAEESQRVLDLQRLQDKNIQFQNELSVSEAQQRTLSIAIKKFQAESKELKEQNLKMKSTLDQVRAKSISDIRRRDVELDKLKNHLSGLNRGKKDTGGGGAKIGNVNAQKAGRDGRHSQQSNPSKEWCLENEPNDFLAAVLNETSTENVALRKIVGDSLAYLRSLTGLEEQEQHQSAVDMASIENAIGVPRQYKEQDLHNSTDSAQSDSLVPVQALGSSMSEVLSHCQTLLRDPSFVPIEEVQIRDEEIAKLRAGWEKMADRWKEAVTMMSQWRQKVMSEGQNHMTIEIQDRQNHLDFEELSSLPIFRRSIATRPNGQPVLDPIQEEELTSMLLDHHSRIENQSFMSNEAETLPTGHDETLPEPDETGTPRQPAIHIHVDEEESDLDLSEHPAPPNMASPARRGIKIQRSSEDDAPERMPLANSNANAKKRKSREASLSPRKRHSLSPISPSNSAKSRTSKHPSSAANSSITMDSTDPLQLDTLTSDISDDEADEDLFAVAANTSGDAKAPRMTVAQKLAAIEAEATEATEVIRRRQATSYGPTDRRGKDRDRAVKSSVGGKPLRKTSIPTVKGSSAKDTTRPQTKTAAKEKDRVKKARDRRRSTLTPAELGSLMGR